MTKELCLSDMSSGAGVSYPFKKFYRVNSLCHTCQNFILIQPKFPRTFSACYRSAVYLSMPIYIKKLKLTKDFGKKPKFYPQGKFFQRFAGSRNKTMLRVNKEQKMCHPLAKILKIGLRVSKIQPNYDIFKESTLQHVHVI